MKPIISLITFIMFVLFTKIAMADGKGITDTSSSPYVKLRSVDLDDVRWTDGFWYNKFHLAHTVTLPSMWEILKDPDIAHTLQNFQIAAGLIDGEFRGNWWFDGDFYKWLEAVAYVYATTNDEDLDRLMDRIITLIGKAQQSDGYIHTPTIIGHGFFIGEKGQFSFKNRTKRWQDLHNHELYSMGHLLSAGCTHYRATGKTTLLNVAEKCANYLHEVFKNRDPKLAHFGFNPSNIMGAVELYRTTKNQKYLELANIFVDMRGSAPGGTVQNQTQTPLRNEREAVGHAVTANYLYAGAADVYAETGDQTLLDALERIWENVVYQKMYLTGATGAIHNGKSPSGDDIHEAYGANYQLPNSTAYNETCANIALAMWSYRMLSITGDARYADIMERVLYNSALSGFSLDGKHYFYTNPLRRTFDAPFLKWDKPTRQSYLECFCCPTNISRTLSKTHGWAYSIANDSVWVNLYGTNVLDTELTYQKKIQLWQDTKYPWDGKVKITVHVPQTTTFSMNVRIPGWSKDVEIHVNGERLTDKLKAGMYTEITRKWSDGDTVELNIPMPVEIVRSDPRIEENRNCAAIQRGPIVYCLESIDLPDCTHVSDIVFNIGSELKAMVENPFPNLLGGVTTIKGKAFLKKEMVWENQLYQSLDLKPIDITLIPYYAWSNRGVTEMTVWLPLVP